ncbi:carbon monoxide dehydrogenase subunit G [Saxibacter everestensis]|uniref:Carbon monoxide dehydrogenase subunit G n=1 Tax=Saxibacter everestensis TaxID=2909229 RepID=A0ABY8QVZ5_9MICO|nr:carbon monoxide dehydrogenase subunit G [Brevibacteriaceae bacterium ZFBP1038]
MKIAGSANLSAPPAEVFDALQDPKVLAASIPGVQTLQRVSDDHYKLKVTAGVASIKGSYDGEVTLSEQERPESFVLTASGAGAPGTIKAIVNVRLAEEDGGTLLSYDADAVVGGMVGGVGQRMITAVAKKMAAVFFTTVDHVMADGIPEPVDPETTGSAGASSAPAASGTSSETASARATRTSNPRTALSGLTAASAGTTGFLAGAVTGATIALAGVLVGGLLGRRRR